MLKRTLIALAAVAATAAPIVQAQDRPAPADGASLQAAPPPAQPAAAPRPLMGEANIRLELTISVTDPRGAALLPAKTATIHVVDRDNGRIRMGRSANSTPTADAAFAATTPVLNVDANPMVMMNGRVRVNLSFEYRPGGPEADKLEAIHINERLSAVVEDGKPMVVSLTTDPASDRTVKVELKATIVK
jgi:hypothetical protein